MDIHITIKLEMDSVCRGCLSMDRALKPLENNVDLFFAVLGNPYIPEDCKYSNLLLCWECSAVLQRIAQYQARIQRSLNIFMDKMTKPFECMSNLSTSSKNNFDYMLEYKQDIIFEVQNIKYEYIKEDKYNESNKSFNEFKAKEENDYEAKKESDIPSDYNVPEEEEKVETKTLKRKRKIFKENHDMKVTDVTYDITDLDSHIKPMDFSFNDIKEMRNRNYSKFLIFYALKKYIDGIFVIKKRDWNKKANEKDVQCSFCKQTVTECIRKHWNEHIFTLFKCQYCNALLNSKGSSIDHLRKYHRKLYTCVCSLKCMVRAEFWKHYKAFHQTFVCDLCPKQYKVKKSIEKHMRSKHLPIKCDFCPKICKTYSQRKDHLYVHHPETQVKSEEALYCVECDIKFLNRLLYRRHITSTKVHTLKPKPKPVPCPECDKTFGSKYYLRDHFAYFHAQKLQYHCDLCDKYFVRQGQLKCHKKYYHDKEQLPRNKICHICNKAFNLNKTLINHIRTHTGERPFKCGYCNAAFAQKAAMKTHEKKQHQQAKT